MARRALVAGGGSGLGQALARRLTQDGWDVAVADIDPASAARTREEIAPLAAAGVRSLALTLDITSEASWAQAVAELERQWGGVDLLINSAGVASSGTVEECSLEQWRWVLDIDLLGGVLGSRAVIPGMKARGGGHIVQVASFAGIANPPAMACYNVAKAGMISLCETLRYELHDHGIGVSVACPSFFKTPLMETSRRQARQAPRGTVNPAPQMEGIVRHLMDTATVTADDVASDIVQAVEKKRFLVITHADARWRYRLKRWAPELFFRMGRRTTAAFLRTPRGPTTPRTAKAVEKA